MRSADAFAFALDASAAVIFTGFSSRRAAADASSLSFAGEGEDDADVEAADGEGTEADVEDDAATEGEGEVVVVVVVLVVAAAEAETPPVLVVDAEACAADDLDASAPSGTVDVPATLADDRSFAVSFTVSFAVSFSAAAFVVLPDAPFDSADAAAFAFSTPLFAADPASASSVAFLSAPVVVPATAAPGDDSGDTAATAARRPSETSSAAFAFAVSFSSMRACADAAN